MGIPRTTMSIFVYCTRGLTLLLALNLLAPVKADYYCDESGISCAFGTSCQVPGVDERCPADIYGVVPFECCPADIIEDDDNDDHYSSSAIVWFIIAGCAGIVAVGAFSWYCCCRRRRQECRPFGIIAPICVPTNATNPAPGYSVLPPPLPPPPAGLPPNWKSFLDAGTGKTYFQRPDGSTTWEMDASQRLLG